MGDLSEVFEGFEPPRAALQGRGGATSLLPACPRAAASSIVCSTMPVFPRPDTFSCHWSFVRKRFCRVGPGVPPQQNKHVKGMTLDGGRRQTRREGCRAGEIC